MSAYYLLVYAYCLLLLDLAMGTPSHEMPKKQKEQHSFHDGWTLPAFQFVRVYTWQRRVRCLIIGDGALPEQAITTEWLKYQRMMLYELLSKQVNEWLPKSLTDTLRETCRIKPYITTHDKRFSLLFRDVTMYVEYYNFITSAILLLWLGVWLLEWWGAAFLRVLAAATHGAVKNVGGRRKIG